MSPQVIGKVLEQDWFVATQMKEMRRSHTATAHAFTPSNALRVLHCMEMAAAKFIRVMGTHHMRMLCIMMYCIVLSLNCVSFVSCDLAPNPDKNRFTDDEQIGANILPVSDKWRRHLLSASLPLRSSNDNRMTTMNSRAFVSEFRALPHTESAEACIERRREAIA